jgi:hypothetical protein
MVLKYIQHRLQNSAEIKRKQFQLIKAMVEEKRKTQIALGRFSKVGMGVEGGR